MCCCRASWRVQAADANLITSADCLLSNSPCAVLASQHLNIAEKQNRIFFTKKAFLVKCIGCTINDVNNKLLWVQILNTQQILDKNCFIAEDFQSIEHFPTFVANIYSRTSYKNVLLWIDQREWEKRGGCWPNKMSHVQITVTWECCRDIPENNRILWPLPLVLKGTRAGRLEEFHA